METKAYNQQVILEFRANKGQVGHLGASWKTSPSCSSRRRAPRAAGRARPRLCT